MDRGQLLEAICRQHGLTAVYLFGSRADDGLALLAGRDMERAGSDLDIGLLFADGDRAEVSLRRMSQLQVAFEDLFAPLRVDLLPLDRVDPIFQYRVIDGHRVLALPPRTADVFELEVMRSASELLPVQRALERDRFGLHTT